MIKKKVLVQGSLKSLYEFFSSPFNREFEPLALVTNELEKVTQAVSRTGGGTQPEIFTLDNLPRFALKFIDGVVLTQFESRAENLNKLMQLGLEPRKIILWNNQGAVEFFQIKSKDGSLFVFMEGLQFHIRNEEDLKFFQKMHGVLQKQRQMYALNPAYYPAMLAQQYRQQFGKPLDWENLQTWTEKMQWIKLYDSTPLKTRLADKYLVRQWVAEKIGAEYVIPLYGVWNNFDEINFDLLPNQFVLKCNHGCGMNIICRDKNNFDFEDAKQKLTSWLQVDYGMRAFEPHYCYISRKIIAEKFMTDGKNFDLIDYKFVCFDGKVFYCKSTTERSTGIRCDYFDLNWQHMNFEQSNVPNSDHPEKIVKPKNFELMKKLAAELCKDFAHVRVDFYEIEGKVYLGEMTFTPAGGNIKWKSKGTDELFGSFMTLPKEKYLFLEKFF